VVTSARSRAALRFFVFWGVVPLLRRRICRTAVVRRVPRVFAGVVDWIRTLRREWRRPVRCANCEDEASQSRVVIGNARARASGAEVESLDTPRPCRFRPAPLKFRVVKVVHEQRLVGPKDRTGAAVSACLASAFCVRARSSRNVAAATESKVGLERWLRRDRVDSGPRRLPTAISGNFSAFGDSDDLKDPDLATTPSSITAAAPAARKSS
jgi:hypothetical protein